MTSEPIPSTKYEQCLRDTICWTCPGLAQITVPTTRTQRRCPQCQTKWSYQRRLQEWEILKLFDQDLPILAAASQSEGKFTVPTIHKCYSKFRELLVEDYLDRIKPPKKVEGLFDQDAILHDLEEIRKVDESQLFVVIAPIWIMPVEIIPGKDRGIMIDGIEYLYRVKAHIAELGDFAPGSDVPAIWPEIAKHAKCRLSGKRNVIEANRLMYILEGAARYQKKPGEITQIIYSTAILSALLTTIGA